MWNRFSQASSVRLPSSVLIFLSMMISFSNGNYPLLDVDTNMRIVLVPFDTPVGTIIYRLKASDSDNNFPLAFEVLGAVGKSLLSIEFLGCSLSESLCQADVVLNKRLDEGRTYEFKLRVRDTTGDYTQVPAVITATSGTASATSVLGTRILHVPEDTPVGSLMQEFVVIKNDFNARVVTLELRDKDERIDLKQRLLSNNRTEGKLYLKKPLDYEKQPWFTFQLLAMNAFTNTNVDTRNVLVSDVIIAVQDVQDTPPEFTVLPTSVEIPKTIRKGDLITKVQAVDGDKQNKRLIRYGFLTDSNPFVNFFDLDPMSGEIFLKRDISQLSTMARPHEPIQMTIIAEEIIPEGELNRLQNPPASAYQQNTSTRAVITFWLGPGVASGPPKFSQDLFVTEVKEDSVIGAHLQFNQDPWLYYGNTEDPVSLTFASANPNSRTNDSKLPFEIVPREGRGNFSFEVRVLDPKLIDYEIVQIIKLKIVATAASGMVTTADFTCHIRDANDNSPIFSQKEYRADIPENAPIGTRVVQVHATDKDSGNNGRVVYTNMVGSEAFRLDAVTGEITVDRPELLDRETEPEIRLYVEAKDGGYTDASVSIDNGFSSVRNIASTTVIITLIDVNDNAPRFTQKYYQAVLTADMSALKYPVRITAEDDDADGPNSLVRYQLTPDSPRQFVIDQMTGELKLRSPFKPDIQNQDGLYLGFVKVKAFDSGTPQQYAETTVQIFAKDVLSRQIQFVLPSKPDLIEGNRKSIEDMLSLLTGGSASIRDIKSLYPSRGLSQHAIPSQQSLTHDTGSSSNSLSSSSDSTALQQQPQQNAAARGLYSDKSVVTTEVTYPVSAAPPVVDLDDFRKHYYMVELISQGGAANRTSDNKIDVLRAENKMLFWLLVAFILFLLLAFAIFLCCIFCPFCFLYDYCKRYDKRREVIQDLRLDKRASDRRSRKTYPERIDEEGEDYDMDAGGPHPGYRREAWSGAENERGRRAGPPRGGGGRGLNQTTHHTNQHQQQQFRSRHNPGDVALQDWEDGAGGGEGGEGGWPPGTYPDGRRLGDANNMGATEGFVSRRAVGGGGGGGEMDRTSEPGNNTYLMQRLNMLPPGARPYPSNYYPPAPRSTANSLPPNEAQLRAQTRPTRFYRTEAGEVLQLDDFEGDEGKELLMRKFINDQDPAQTQNDDSGPMADPINAQQQLLINNTSHTSLRAIQESQHHQSTSNLADRPKGAAATSRRSREALGQGSDDEEDEDRKKASSTPPSPSKRNKKKLSRSESNRRRGGGEDGEDEEDGGGGGRSKRQKHRRNKSRSISLDSANLSASGGKCKSKSKSKSKSRSRSKSPLVTKSKPRKSGSRSRTRSRSPSKDKKKSHHKSKVPKSKKLEEQREKTAAAVAAAVAKRHSGDNNSDENNRKLIRQQTEERQGPSGINISVTIPAGNRRAEGQAGGDGASGYYGGNNNNNAQYGEEDGDSGIGIIPSKKRHKMLEKKSVFTIAYDEMASQKVLRPDTAMRPGTMDAL